MFTHKKSTLPPRPHPPLTEQILEDISNADKHDVAFKTSTKDESRTSNDSRQQQPFAVGDTESIYETFKSYLRTRESLNELSDALKAANESLIKSDAEMKRMAEDIIKQAQEALGKH